MRARNLLAALLLALACGCTSSQAPPPIALGTPCAKCGMEIQDRRFACERRADNRWRTYDSIECLLADASPLSPASAWLADYDAQTLHRGDSLWVVHGQFASPMGGGYAAFVSRGAADSVAADTHGSVSRLGGPS